MESQKITNSHLSKPKRWYQDASGTALSMDLLGERWSVLIMRELLLGPRCFGEMRGSLVGLSANLLTQRLEVLDQAGLVRELMLTSPANAQVFEPTRRGTDNGRVQCRERV